MNRFESLPAMRIVTKQGNCSGREVFMDIKNYLRPVAGALRISISTLYLWRCILNRLNITRIHSIPQNRNSLFCRLQIRITPFDGLRTRISSFCRLQNRITSFHGQLNRISFFRVLQKRISSFRALRRKIWIVNGYYAIPSFQGMEEFIYVWN